MSEPCQDCPPIRLPIPDGPPLSRQINYLLNQDGPQSLFYRMVEHAIPAGDLECGRPICHEDGSLEFPIGTPADLYGYGRDSENPRRFHPAWPECIHRTLGVFIQEKQLVVAGQCNNPAFKGYGRPVTLDLCRDCPVRQMVTVVKPRPSTVSEMVAAMVARGKAATEARINANEK